MGQPTASGQGEEGGRAGGQAGCVPILCLEHISKTMLAMVMKFMGG